MPDPAPNAELLRALGRLVRGLSVLFWGLPLALVACVQTAKTEWLRQFGLSPTRQNTKASIGRTPSTDKMRSQAPSPAAAAFLVSQVFLPPRSSKFFGHR